MNDVSNLRDTIIPKSDQLNSEQLLSGPMTITVTSVNRGSDDQPVAIHYEGEAGRPFKPCKSMRKVLIFAWGDDGGEWIGKSMTLYNDPTVKFGGVKVGGLRISHLSHIDRDIALMLTATKGKKQEFIIKKLVDVPAAGGAKRPAPASSHQPPADNGTTAQDSSGAAYITAEQEAKLRTDLEFAGLAVEAFCRWLKIETLGQLPAVRYDGAVEWIKNKADAAA